MSDESKDGGPAFPSELHPHFEGMTLRDYFAAQALCGILADPNCNGPDFSRLEVAVATQSYQFADAMLEARKRGQ